VPQQEAELSDRRVMMFHVQLVPSCTHIDREKNLRKQNRKLLLVIVVKAATHRETEQN
jgi:hypothetical protein